MSTDKENGSLEIPTGNPPKTLPEPQTYFLLGSEETGLIEVDLVTVRKKNEKTKYLSFTVVQAQSEGLDQTMSTFYLDNEAAFLLLKNFFIQLDWNG